MGREVRRVPADWQHPTNEKGHYIPLFDGADLARRTANWDEGAAKWAEGFVKDYSGRSATGWRPRDSSITSTTYAEWSGERPDPADYMPAWPDEQRTHLMMYEDTSEGTPISPAFPTAEELARWLADNEASAFADLTASYEGWLATIRRGSSIGLCINIGTGEQIPGVEMNAR